MALDIEANLLIFSLHVTFRQVDISELREVLPSLFRVLDVL